MIFVDANYFLRFLDDSSEHHETAKELFLEAAQGKKSCITSTVVLFEVYWVLKSFYGLGRTELATKMESLLKMEFIGLPDRHIAQRAVRRFSTGTLALEDCFHLENANELGCSEIATFDKKLAKAFTQKH